MTGEEAGFPLARMGEGQGEGDRISGAAERMVAFGAIQSPSPQSSPSRERKKWVAGFGCAVLIPHDRVLPLYIRLLTGDWRRFYSGPMLKLSLDRSFLVGIVCLACLVAFGGIAVAATPGKGEAAAEEKAEPAAGEGGDEATAGKEEAEEAPTPDPEAERKAAEEACKEALEGLRSKDVSALQALTVEERNTLLAGPTGVSAITCLAIGNADKSLCDLLDGDAKRACLDQWAVGSELTGLPKEQIKAQLLFRSCSANSTGPHCEVLRQAVNEGSSEKCQELEDPSHRAFCTAVASGDASKCEAIPAGSERAYCAAFASDDPSKCPKDSVDCIAMANGFAALKKGGLEVFQDIDATIAAAALGSKACDALVDKLLESCATVAVEE